MAAIPFPFQSLMKLLLVSMTSGLVLYTCPTVVAAVLPRPLGEQELFMSFLVTMVVSILMPLLIRLVNYCINVTIVWFITTQNYM